MAKPQCFFASSAGCVMRARINLFIKYHAFPQVLHKLRGIAGTLATPSGRREELRSQVWVNWVWKEKEEEE
eukprot:scaffold302504_cov21-Tisochrysis_lutea.AAC.2